MWKDVIGYNGDYQVNDLGELRSLKRSQPKTMKLSEDKDGYLVTGIYKDGKRHNIRVHRLVAEAFIPNPLNLPEVNHKDGNKLNNSIDNLEWCNKQDNITHAVSTGLRNDSGDNNVNAKLTQEDVTYIKNNYKPYHKEFSAVALAKKFGVTKTTIHDITKGRSWNG